MCSLGEVNLSVRDCWNHRYSLFFF